MNPQYSDTVTEIFGLISEANYYFIRNDIYSGYNILGELSIKLRMVNSDNLKLSEKYPIISNSIKEQIVHTLDLLGFSIKNIESVDINSFDLLDIVINQLTSTPYYTSEFEEKLIEDLLNLAHDLEISVNKGKRDRLKAAVDQVIKMIGELYIFKGEFNLALQYFDDYTTMVDIDVKNQSLALWNKFLGLIHLYNGDFTNAIDYLNLGLEKFEETNQAVEIADTLLYLIYIYLELDLEDKINEYMRKFDELISKRDNKHVAIRKDIAEALAYKKNPRARIKVRALEIFSEIIENPIVENKLSVLCMINTCELLIWELRDPGNEEIFDEITKITDKLSEIATNLNSYPLFIEINLLKSKLALLELDISKSQRFLDEAEELVKKKELGFFDMKVTNQKEQLYSELSKWVELVNRNAPMIDRLKAAKIDEFMQKVIKGMTSIF
jgi:tetratricopeptide (TPR) repeat protein